ncbi:MAG: ACP S-malonyltransferase, partial [Prochloraceae cyanobacterium]
LGEYMALYAAKVFDFETGLRLMKRRGELMESSTEGAIATLIGFNQEQLEQQIQQTANVWRVNDDLTNAVISGTPEAVESVLTKIKAKRIIRLNPSRAFHTPLIAATAAEFQQILESTPFESAEVPVLSSIEPTPIVEAAQLKKNLIKQMIEPVCWRKISLKLAAEGVERVVEIGPGKGLTKQMKRICSDLISTNISSAEQISTLKVAEGNYHLFLKNEHENPATSFMATA